MSFEPPSTDPVICHCLGIKESEIRSAGRFSGCQTVSDVKVLTEAGSGCTSCHRHIIALLQESRREAHIEGLVATSDATAAAAETAYRVMDTASSG